MDLNQLNARLLKAQMMGNVEMIEKIKEEIEQFKEKNQRTSSNKQETSDDKLKMNNELNRLNARLVKAEMLNDSTLIEECEQAIRRHQSMMKNSNGQLSKKSTACSDELNQLSSKMLKAEMRNDLAMVDELKAKISKLKNEMSIETSNRLNDAHHNSTADRSSFAPKHEDTAKNSELKSKVFKRNEHNEMPQNNRRPLIEQLSSAKDSGLYSMSFDSVEESSTARSLDQPKETKVIRVVRKPNENNMSLKQMFVSERNAGAHSEDALFVATTSRMTRDDEEYDGFAGAKRQKKQQDQVKYIHTEDDEDKTCSHCLESLKSLLIIENDDKVILLVPEREPLVDYELNIQSVEHCESIVSAGEDVNERVMQLKHKMCMLFESMDKRVIFIEQFINRKRNQNKHLLIRCYPIPADDFEEAKICFKKDISEAEGRYALNKKIIYLTNERPLNKSIPKSFSYFCVTFGATNVGYAHVIEDYQRFSHKFGQETIGSLLNLDHERWFSPKLQNYKELSERAANLKKLWSRLTVSSK